MKNDAEIPNLVFIPGNKLFPDVEKILNDGAPFRLVVSGRSMIPFLRGDRDSVLLMGIKNYSIKRGDIILIKRHNGQYVLHRVRKLLPDGFILNGDAQQWTEKVPYDQVIAVVGEIYRGVKTIRCDSFYYKLLYSIWMLLLPFRPLIFRTACFCKRFLN